MYKCKVRWHEVREGYVYLDNYEDVHLAEITDEGEFVEIVDDSIELIEAEYEKDEPDCMYEAKKKMENPDD
jgi:hypothetical protein